MSFTYRIIAVFFIHLILVVTLGIIVITAYDPSPNAHNEVQEAWLVFTVIDYPTALLFYPIGALVCSIGLCPPDNYYLDCVFWPAVTFQLLGTINWVIICEFCRAIILWCLCVRLSDQCPQSENEDSEDEVVQDVSSDQKLPVSDTDFSEKSR